MEFFFADSPINPVKCTRNGRKLELVLTGSDMDRVLNEGLCIAPIVSERQTDGSFRRYVLRQYKEEGGLGKLHAEETDPPSRVN